MFSVPHTINHPIAAPDVATLLTDKALLLGHTMEVDSVRMDEYHRHRPDRFTEYSITGTIVPSGTVEKFNFHLVVEAVYEPKACDPDDVVRLVNQGTRVTDSMGTVLVDSIEQIPAEWRLLSDVDNTIEACVRYIVAYTA